ncbi:MAG: hypothetical protein HFH46_03970, partial [Bacilli bacterium]|nr:hypothetical protein [Bacilli bacterium]
SSLEEGSYYVHVKDAAGHVSRTSSSYEVYHECSYDNSKWSECEGDCGTGIRHWVDKRTGKDCPNTESSCDLDPCYETVYTCRYQNTEATIPGQSCIHNIMDASDCSHNVKTPYELHVEDVDGKWYKIIDGTHKGRYILQKCTKYTRGAVCAGSTCPG